MLAPVASWTPAESSVFADALASALVASLDGGAPRRLSFHAKAPFRAAFVPQGEHDVGLEITIDAAQARLSLEPPPEATHPWRDGWVVELERPGDSSCWLTKGAAPVEIANPRRGALIARLRWNERELSRRLSGDDVVLPLIDVAFHRHTRQSTRAPVTQGQLPWMTATEPEPAPWWELDLGRGMFLDSLQLRLHAPPAGARLAITCYGYATPAGNPPATAPRHEFAIDDLVREPGGQVRVTLAPAVVARAIRVTLLGQGPCVLAVRALEAMAVALHDGTLVDSMRRSFALFHDRPLALARDASGTYQATHSYGEVWSRSQALARALAARLEPRAGRAAVAVVLGNRVEWVIAELAALARGYLMVPLSPEDPEARLTAILAQVKPACVIGEARDAARLARSCPAAVLVLCDDASAGGFDALIRDGEQRPATPPVPRSEDDVWTILFTSGSTGTPKGAMRSHRSFRAMLDSYQVAHSVRHLSFQPLSHLSERMYLPALLLAGATIAFSRGGAHIMDELAALSPDGVGSVPRLFEVLHASYRRRLAAALAAEPDRPRAEIEARERARIRSAFGDRLQSISVGSAPVSGELLSFLRRCFADVWVTEGYGATEVGTIAINGVIASHVEVKLVPRPDAPDRAPGDPERGEIWVRTPHVITGYLGEAAARTDDGFFATGDLGERDPQGRVRVLGRLASAVKLANGEFVSAERIELALGEAPLVDRVFVFVEPGASAVAALLLPEVSQLARLLDRQGTLAELAADPRAAELAAAALRAQGRRAGLAPWELPRGVLLLGQPLTVENGLLTSSGKLARGALRAEFAATLRALAQEGEPAEDVTAQAELGDADLTARVTRAVSRVLGRPLGLHDPLASAAIDSLAVAEILVALSEELGRDVPHQTWFSARDLAELAAGLEEDAGAAGSALALAAEDRARVYAVDPAAAPASSEPPRTLLLTGATGFLGAHLLEAVLARTSLHVTCLVRASDDRAAAQRIAAQLTRLGIAPAPTDRVQAVAGDLAAPDLGLAPARRDQLAHELDAILHGGATVNWLSSYRELRAANVAGTLSLLTLAASRRIKPLHFVSTISTAPADGDEQSFLPHDTAIRGTPYGLSKWIAEEHVRRAAATLPIAVYRPAMIAGHSQRGHGNQDDFLHRYLAGVVELGRYVDLEDARIDFTPVDYVASAIVALLTDLPLGGETYHLANVDQSPSYAALGRALAAAGAAVTPASYPEFRAALLAHRGRLSALAPFFPETGFAMAMGPWPCQRTVAATRALGVDRPAIDAAMIARYLRSATR